MEKKKKILPFRFVQQIPGGGLWVLPSAGVGAALLPPHGSDHRVLAGRHQVFPPCVLHLRPDRSLGREGELLTELFSLPLRSRYLNLHICPHRYFLYRSSVCFNVFVIIVDFIWLCLAGVIYTVCMYVLMKCKHQMWIEDFYPHFWRFVSSIFLKTSSALWRGAFSNVWWHQWYIVHRDGAFACWSGSFANIARCRLALRCFQGKVSPPWMYFKKCILDCQYGSFFAMATQGTAAKKPVRPKKRFPIDRNIKINASKTADRKTFDLQHSS